MNPAELERRLAAYIAVRQTLGYAMRAERTLLFDFKRFITERGVMNPIRAQMAVDWATQSSGRGVAGAATRLTMARRFLLHLRGSYPDTEIPGINLLATARRPTPYLFSEAEVTALIEASRKIGPRGSLRPLTLATLIFLLDSTGLRVGEVVHLSIGDVMLTAAPPRLVIRDTKFGKSRLVPLHPTTAVILAQYVAERKRLSYDGLSDAFFISERGAAFSVSSLGRWFGQLVLRVGLWPEKGKRWPCLRSFRHTFAVRRLRTWYEEGADVTTLLPHLSVYLGHLSPKETYWYLTSTPELLGVAADRFRSYVGKGGDQ